MRVGQGFDVHRTAPGDSIVIGGVRITHDHTLLAHSDGDVLIHALCDALLGAAALGDIGEHFPDHDPRWRDIDSRSLLRTVVEMLDDRGLITLNADMTVIAEAPRMAPHVAQMCANIASDLGCTIDRVNVKATTTEGLGFCGRREGIAAQAVVLVGEGQ